MSIVRIEPSHESQGTFVEIDEADFDAATMKPFKAPKGFVEPEAPVSDGPVTVEAIVAPAPMPPETLQGAPGGQAWDVPPA